MSGAVGDEREGLDVQTVVMRDLAERREFGTRKYGTPLRPHNGRDALRDAYEEALDLACYLKQALIEQELSAGG